LGTGFTVLRNAKIDFRSSSLILRNTHHGIGGFSGRALKYFVKPVAL
jgi:hypothetical protein